jgi:DNA-binding winged helix-turn-helix (wHTH) protein
MARHVENEFFKPAADYADPRLKIYVQHRRVRFDGAVVPLPDREFDVLATLAANEGRTVSRRALLTGLWNFPHVHRLRTRLKDQEGLNLETVFGVGYRFRRFADPAESSAQPEAAPDSGDGPGASPKPMGAVAVQSMAIAL